MPKQIHPIGRHTVEVDGDVVFSTLEGDFTLDDVKAFYALVGELSKEHPVYCIGDARRAGSMTAEARRYAIEQSKGLRIECNVVFGMGPVMRTILILLGRAAKLVGRGGRSSESKFVSSQEEALAYVETVRARRAMQGPGPASRNSLR